MVPVGSVFAAILLERKVLTLNALLLLGGALQTIGIALFVILASEGGKVARQYGFQVVVGTGIGFVTTATFLLVPIKMEKRDLGTLT
jgi:hypothetical protein